MLAAILHILLAAQQTVATSASLEKALHARLETFLGEGSVPGVSAGVVLADGEGLALAAGFADREKKTPLEPDDLMCGGSSGKTFVAAVALQLVEEDRLRLEDLAGEYLGEEPWFERLPNAPDLTLEHLLGHRTGIPRHEFDPAFMQAMLSAPDRVWKPEGLVTFVLDKEPPFAAGEGFAYSDTNFILVGMIVERVTRKPLYDEIERRILKPFALAGIVPQVSRSIPGLVQGHVGAENPFGAREWTLDAEGRFFLNPQFEWAGGGFVGSGGALARWAKTLYEGEALDPETRARMVAGKEAPELGRGTRYGLGCEVWSTPHGEAWGHAGFFPGYLTEMRYWPEHRIAVAVQVNTSEYAALPEPLGVLCDELLALAAGGGSKWLIRSRPESETDPGYQRSFGHHARDQPLFRNRGNHVPRRPWASTLPRTLWRSSRPDGYRILDCVERSLPPS